MEKNLSGNLDQHLWLYTTDLHIYTFIFHGSLFFVYHMLGSVNMKKFIFLITENNKKLMYLLIKDETQQIEISYQFIN
jgi:hypothetical protein